ncbi:General substrate transporter [Ascosphaera apis ARSEF 7405]|uniref:General substrate transporter n=1 Tax=Ascosphaera apis ARSEF 7405 TaxID=392613 RepID=A0A168C950_9EURO|nr:General substrate transporter [Ascosphaera apis ARSEF 7405]
MYQLFITLGIFTANCINYGTEDRAGTDSWRIPLGITLIWGAILGIGILFFPESPRYDYRWGRERRAAQTLRAFYGVPENHVVIQRELEEIHEKVEEDKSLQDEKWYEMFSYPTMKQRLFVGTALQGLQQLSGANYYFYYATTVFKGAGIENDYVTQMILGGVNFGTTFLGLYFIERFGRRPSLFYGAIWMFVCFMVYSSVGHFALNRDDPTKTPAAGKALVIFSCLFILGYASTWGPIIWAVIAELYPSRYRARAMAIPTAFNWMWNFLISFFTPFIVSAIDFRYGYVFTGCLGLSAFLIYFGVMETKGRTLEEIDTLYKLGVKPWKSAGYVIPAPEGEAEEEFGRYQEQQEQQSGGPVSPSENQAHIGPRLTPQLGVTDSSRPPPGHTQPDNSQFNVPSQQSSSAASRPQDIPGGQDYSHGPGPGPGPGSGPSGQHMQEQSVSGQ